jgi:hypothetical protein
MSSSRNAHAGYEDVEEIIDPEGVVGVISRRKYNGTLTLALFKIFDRDGVEERTNFLGSKHLAAARRVLEIAQERMAKLEATSEARQ